jgi:hypothetical protein
MSQNGYLTFSGYADPTDPTVNPVTFYGYDPNPLNDIILYNSAGPVLNALSSSATSSLQGLYSIKQVLSSYTGPVLNLQRSSDNSKSDFYADQNGNLWTGANGTGSSYTSWVNGGTAGVATWYDQSGKNNNATQSTQTSQPRYNDSSKLIDFSTNLNNQLLALPNGTFPTGDSSYTITLKHGTITYYNINGIFGSGSPGTVNDVLALGVYNGTGTSSFYRQYWWGDDLDTPTIPISVGNIITCRYTTGAGLNSRATYVNGTISAQGQPSSVRAGTSLNNYIGYGDSINNNYFNGQMYYLSIFSSALSSTDRAIVESQ